MQMRQLGRTGKEMHVRFDEAGQHRTALGIDDFGGRPLQGFDDSTAADCEDGPVLDGNGFCDGTVVIHGQHTAVYDDQIGLMNRTSDRHRDSALLTDQDRLDSALHT